MELYRINMAMMIRINLDKVLSLIINCFKCGSQRSTDIYYSLPAIPFSENRKIAFYYTNN